MTFTTRIRTIYRKELSDILRDRRTLIAMIVVPIVLYPLLMVGSIQAVSYQAESLQQETVIVGVVQSPEEAALRRLIEADARTQESEVEGKADPLSNETGSRPSSNHFRIIVTETIEALEQAIRERVIHVGVRLPPEGLIDSAGRRNDVDLFVDQQEVRSASASRRLQELFDRTAERTKRTRLENAGLPEHYVDPFSIRMIDLSTPPSILGQVLPLVLVLMTITGAIYPAIDLTAGERERGTLESLMVCPVPVIDLIVGKFLVVTTVAIVGASLNLASVSLTVYFGGFNKVIASMGGGVPLAKMAMILLCLIPFAVLMSAIMLAVCSFARTFKEAQNYVTPVILAVLIPGGIAALPASRLEGLMLVMPVGNMVLLSREWLLGAGVSAWQVAMVVLSTTLYAAAAVSLAANVFGRESVVFADSGSLKTLLSRAYQKPRRLPPVSLALFIIALMFPVWFFLQSSFAPKPEENPALLFRGTALAMPIFFVALPLAALFYARIDWKGTFAIRPPRPIHLLAAVLLGATAWVPVHELILVQQSFIPLSQNVAEELARITDSIRSLHPLEALALIAIVPAVCEELLFRGLLLTGLTTAARWGTAVVVSALIFGVFHFMLVRFLPTTLLGMVLAFLCYRSRSILPSILMHLLHNGLGVSVLFWPWREAIGITGSDSNEHLPAPVLFIGGSLFLFGILIVSAKSVGAIERGYPLPVLPAQTSKS